LKLSHDRDTTATSNQDESFVGTTLARSRARSIASLPLTALTVLLKIAAINTADFSALRISKR
jgi:hypothetical protein